MFLGDDTVDFPDLTDKNINMPSLGVKSLSSPLSLNRPHEIVHDEGFRRETFLLDSALPMLTELPCSIGHASIDPVARAHAGINDQIIRLSGEMGDVNDLIDDPDFGISFSGKAA